MGRLNDFIHNFIDKTEEIFNGTQGEIKSASGNETLTVSNNGTLISYDFDSFEPITMHRSHVYVLLDPTLGIIDFSLRGFTEFDEVYNILSDTLWVIN